ncbi:hypothetical protein D3C72_1073370 [compost metagenome]
MAPMSTAPASIQPHTRMNPNNRVRRMNNEGSGSSGDTVTARARAMIITAIRTLSRARPSIPFQKTSRLRTASFNRAKTT